MQIFIDFFESCKDDKIYLVSHGQEWDIRNLVVPLPLSGSHQILAIHTRYGMVRLNELIDILEVFPKPYL